MGFGIERLGGKRGSWLRRRELRAPFEWRAREELAAFWGRRREDWLPLGWRREDWLPLGRRRDFWVEGALRTLAGDNKVRGDLGGAGRGDRLGFLRHEGLSDRLEVGEGAGVGAGKEGVGLRGWSEGVDLGPRPERVGLGPGAEGVNLGPGAEGIDLRPRAKLALRPRPGKDLLLGRRLPALAVGEGPRVKGLPEVAEVLEVPEGVGGGLRGELARGEATGLGEAGKLLRVERVGGEALVYESSLRKRLPASYSLVTRFKGEGLAIPGGRCCCCVR